MFITSGNWRVKHNSLSSGAGCEGSAGTSAVTWSADMTFRLRETPPQRQTVYYAHTGRAVVATHELFMEVGDHTFIRPLLPLYDAVRALAPPWDTETCALIRVGNKVRTINEPWNTELRLVVPTHF